MPEEGHVMGNAGGATAYVFASDAYSLLLASARALKPYFGDLIQICDGVDDQDDINAAIDALVTAGGKCQLVGPNFYDSESIDVSRIAGYSTITLAGEGYSTVISSPAGATALGDHFIKTSIVTNRNMYLTIRDLSIDGTNQTGATSCGIYLWAASYSRILDVEVKNCASHGIHVDGDVTWTAVDIVVRGAKLNGNGNYGFYCGGSITDVTYDGLTVFGNTVGGIYAGGGGSILTAVRSYDNGGYQLIINGFWVQVEASNFDGSGGDGCIYVYGTGDYFEILGCTIKDGTYGVRVSSSAPYGQIKNNYFSGCTTVVDDGPGSTDIRGNVGYIAPGEKRRAKGALTAGVADAFCFAWQNPESAAVIVTRLVVDVTTAGGTATAVLNAGTAANGTTESDDLIDGADLNAIAVRDNIEDRGTNGKSRQKLAANGGATDFVTGVIKTANAASLAGKYYIEYMAV
jgi:parallel beta-helix repeat protein